MTRHMMTACTRFYSVVQVLTKLANYFCYWKTYYTFSGSVDYCQQKVNHTQLKFDNINMPITVCQSPLHSELSLQFNHTHYEIQNYMLHFYRLNIIVTDDTVYKIELMYLV